MSTSTRVTQSKGESDGLSLPTRMRPTRKDTTSGRNEGDRDQQQQMPAQSPLVTSTERTETTSPMLPPGLHRPLTPHVSLPTSPIPSSISSAPLFKEDKYSSTSEEESEVEAEVTFLHDRSRTSGMFANNQTGNPMSMPTTSDYMTQVDPAASPSASNKFRSAPHSEFLNTNNFLCQTAVTDESTRYPIRFFRQAIWKMEQCIPPGATGFGENAKYTKISNGQNVRAVLRCLRK